jgi:HK97 family phage portal protein
MPITSKMVRSMTFHVSQQPPGFITQGYGDESFAGESVTVEGALSVASVLSAFTILMEDTASLPLITYRRLTRGKERATDNPLYELLHDIPNPEHTSMVYREFIMGHLLGWGNHFSQKIWDSRGTLVELWPLRPDRMKVFRENGVRKYLYTEMNGTPRSFRQEEIWHIPAFDGLVGYSRITLARNAIGLSIAAEKFGSKFFGNGAVPGLAIKHPAQLSDDAYRHLSDSWNANHRGAENAHKPAILEEGMSIEKIGIPPDDAQFIETRRFQLGEIARMFRVPPHMLGDVERSTSWGSGIEQQELGYLSHTLRPWLKRIEQQANKDLLLETEHGELMIEHLVEDFLRTDIQTRMLAYVQAITNGIMTRNEVRERENLIPMDDLDEMLMPLNMTTTSKASEKDMADEMDDQSEDAIDETDILAEDDQAQKEKKNFDARPFVLDAVRRIVRREAKEVVDAAKRWIGKGKPEKFTQWIEQFYSRDHMEFVKRTFEPLAQFGQERLEIILKEYLTRQSEEITRAYSDGENFETLTESWMYTITEPLVDQLMCRINEAQDE